MLRLFCAVYAALLLGFCCTQVSAQNKLENYAILGHSETTVFLADIKDAKTSPGGNIEFSSAIGRIDSVDKAHKQIVVDPDNLFFINVVANCFSYKYHVTNEHGVINGQPFNDDKKDADSVPDEQSPIYHIIAAVCTAKLGERAE